MEWLSWENPVAIWWVGISCAGAVNIAIWFWTRYFGFRGHGIEALSKLWFENKNIIWFSALYVFVCAFRSFLPRADVQRICLFDTWLSSVLIGRTVATIGELAFVAQWVIVLRFLATETSTGLAKKISHLILPLILSAELFSWYAVITTHYLGNAIEESLWALTYTLIGIAILTLFQKLKGSLKLAAGFSVIGCILYVLFMVTVDVPMYLSRLIAESKAQKPLLGLIDGFHDLNTRWIVTRSIHDWKTEIPWQTLYFTFAVLVSLALCYVPLTRERIKKFLI